MEKLEIAIRQKEEEFITHVHSILSSEGGNRAKIALINRYYIKYMVALDDLVRDAKLEPQQGVAASS